MAGSDRDEIAKLEALYSANPEGRIFTHLADAYRRVGDLGRARELVERGLRLHAEYSSAHVVLARILLAQGEGEAAEGAYRRVLALDPENRVALRALADLAHGAGRAAEAAEHLKELLLLNPGDEDARALLVALEGAGSAVVAEGDFGLVELDATLEPPESSGSEPGEFGLDISPDAPLDAEVHGAPDLVPAAEEAGGTSSNEVELELVDLAEFGFTEGEFEVDGEFEVGDGSAAGALVDDLLLESTPADDLSAADDLPADDLVLETSLLEDDSPDASPVIEEVLGLEDGFGFAEPAAVTESFGAGDSVEEMEQVADDELMLEGEDGAGEDFLLDGALLVDERPGIDEDTFADDLPLLDDVVPTAEPPASAAVAMGAGGPVGGEETMSDELGGAAGDLGAIELSDELGGGFDLGLVVTETMADLYASQGLTAQAAEVYRELLRTRPDDSGLQSKLANLGRAGAAPVAPRPEPPTEVVAEVVAKAAPEFDDAVPELDEVVLELDEVVPELDDAAPEPDEMVLELDETMVVLDAMLPEPVLPAPDPAPAANGRSIGAYLRALLAFGGGADVDELLVLDDSMIIEDAEVVADLLVLDESMVVAEEEEGIGTESEALAAEEEDLEVFRTWLRNLRR